MSAGHDDYAVEPIRGLPQSLPPGETILWQGAPGWWEMAKQVFHIRIVALYLLALTAWRFSVHMQGGHVREAVVAALSLLPIAFLALGLLAFLAWLCSRTSVYTITSRRIVMRIGVALPTAVNIPFAMIGAAHLRSGAHATGNISLSLNGEERIAYSNFWPHVRPWRLARPEPMLRGIADVRGVAALLADALASALPEGTIRTTAVKAPSGRGNGGRAVMVPGGQMPDFISGMDSAAHSIPHGDVWAFKTEYSANTVHLC